MMSTSPDTTAPPRRTFWLVATIVVIGSAAPLVLYGVLFGHISTVTPRHAQSLLDESGSSIALVDIRSADAFAAGHIDGAVSWPMDDVLTLMGPKDLPTHLQNKKLLLICEVGMRSRWAAWLLDQRGVGGAINVRGGIQEWIHGVTKPEDQTFERWRTGPDSVGPFPQRPSPPWEQTLAVLAYFLIKPTYTVLALLFVILLWRTRAPDLAALRWGLIFFFLGENACGANYLLFKEQSYLLEYFHSLGMLLCFGFVAYAVLEGIDRRILMLSDAKRRCAAMGLCGACIKYADVPCGLKRTFYLIIPAAIIVSLMLPSADWQDSTYGTTVFRTFYCYGHLRVFQQFENWYCAAAAATLFSISLVILATRKGNDLSAAKITFAAGLGPFGFGMLRMLLGAAYDQNRVWYLFWEEGTEFLFVLGIGVVLWIFRTGLVPDLNFPSAWKNVLSELLGQRFDSTEPDEAPRDASEAR